MVTWLGELYGLRPARRLPTADPDQPSRRSPTSWTPTTAVTPGRARPSCPPPRRTAGCTRPGTVPLDRLTRKDCSNGSPARRQGRARHRRHQGHRAGDASRRSPPRARRSRSAPARRPTSRRRTTRAVAAGGARRWAPRSTSPTATRSSAGYAATAEPLGRIDIVVANVSAARDRPDRGELGGVASRSTSCTRAPGGRGDAVSSSGDAASIVAISSVSGREIDFATGAYGTMKAALVHYMQGLAFHLAAKGIRANSSRRVTPTSPAACGPRSRRTNPTCSTARWHSTRPAGWPRRRRSPTPSRCSPARGPSRITGTNVVVDGALTRGVQL